MANQSPNQEEQQVTSEGAPRRSRAWIVKQAIRVLVLSLVAWGIWGTVAKAIVDLPTHRISWSDIELKWIALAGLLYVAGLTPCWLFWHRTLLAMGQKPRLRESLCAFWIGHLGKYVPGKAMVVVLRTGLVHSERVSKTVAATSVFVETLTMMAVGAFLSAVILFLISDNLWFTLLAAGLMLGSGVPTLPPIFRRIVRMLRVDKANPQIESAIAGVDYRLMLTGWITISLGWVLLGASLWATLKALPGAEPPLSDLPLLTASVGLAMVAGFLSLIPGGLFVRDGILTELLATPYGSGYALGSAIILRVIWLMSELLVSAILYVDVWRTRRASSSIDSRPA